MITRCHLANLSTWLDPLLSRKRIWPNILVVVKLTVLIATGIYLNWDVDVLTGVAVLVGLLIGLFVLLVGLIGLVRLTGPIIIKVLSFSLI